MAIEVQKRGSYSAHEYFTIEEDSGARVRSAATLLVLACARHVRLLVILPVMVAVVAVLPSYLFGRTYVAESSFLPEAGSSGTQRFAGLAAQFGIALGAAPTSESLDSYVDLAKSRAILGEVALKTYHLRSEGLFGDSTSGTLLDTYHISAPTAAQRLQLAIKRLAASTDVTGSVKSGMVTIRTTAPSREMAETLNRNILDAISSFNLNKRQSRASAERTFVGGQLEEAKAKVDAAEGAVAGFLAQNRQYQGSPQLVVEYGRLQRRVELEQQVYSTLAQAYEQARIEEVRNTPVITIVDRPEGSATFARTRRQVALIAVITGLLLAVACAYVIEWFKDLRSRQPQAVDQLREDLGPILGRLLPHGT